MRRAFSVIRWIFGAILTFLGTFGLPKGWANSDDILGWLARLLKNSLSQSYFALCGALVLAYCAAEILAERRFKRLTARPPANFEAWDQVNLFTLWQAAWLWNDVEPVSPDVLNTLAHPTLRRLEDAISSGAIKDVEPGFQPNSKISRQIWIDYAIAMNERPRFLFPAQRNLVSKFVERLSVREIKQSELWQYYTLDDIYFAMRRTNVSVDYEKVQAEVLQNLVDGKAVGVGRKMFGDLLGPYQKIPRRKWKNLKIDFRGVFDKQGNKAYEKLRLSFPKKEAAQTSASA